MAVKLSRTAQRFGVGLLAAGALALGGCAVVPAGPYYDVGAPVAVAPGGYYGGYGAAPYAYGAPYGYAYRAPYVVAPTVSLGIWGGFGGGGYRHGRVGHRGGFRR